MNLDDCGQTPLPLVMPRNRVPSLPLLSKKAGRGNRDKKTSQLLQMLREVALRAQEDQPREFYSLRDVAKNFAIPISAASRLYRALAAEGLLQTVRSSKTLLQGLARDRHLSVRGVVALPASLSSFITLQDYRMFLIRVRARRAVSDAVVAGIVCEVVGRTVALDPLRHIEPCPCRCPIKTADRVAVGVVAYRGTVIDAGDRMGPRGTILITTHAVLAGDVANGVAGESFRRLICHLRAGHPIERVVAEHLVEHIAADRLIVIGALFEVPNHIEAVLKVLGGRAAKA